MPNENKLERIAYSAFTSDVFAQVLRGKVFELVRNKRPSGIFIVRKPQSEAELLELVDILRAAFEVQ
jgi:hypothetical protein